MNASLLVSTHTITKQSQPITTGLNQSFECFLGEVYEFATFLSVEKKNIEEFERNICVLKSYYDEFDSIIGKS